MRQQDITKQLGSLRGVAPDEGFAQSSKHKIIYGTSPKPGGFYLFSESLSSTLSMALVVIFFAFVTIGGVSKILTAPTSPTFEGIGGPGLTAEATDINEGTDIHIKDAEYLADQNKRFLAKATAAQEDVIIPEEDEEVTDEEIDQLLSKAKSY